MSAELARVVAVVAAVCAAASFGAAGLLQHRATQQAPPRGPLRPRLLLDLIRIKSFRWGVVFGALGFALQVVALRFAPLTLVQPILVTGVLFYLGFAAAYLRRPPDTVLVGGALLALIGVSAFLLAARPTAGDGHFAGSSALPLGLALIVIVAVCLAVGSRLPQEIRAVPTAVATAVCYGVTAGLVRSLVTTPDLATFFGQWQVYAIVVVGPAGFLLNQNAFQEGALGSVAVAIITVGDPIASIGVGVAWLGESIASGLWRTPMEVLALIVMAAGVWLLAGRAQQVADQMRSDGGPRAGVG